jgi:hypothetical protein
MSSNWFYVVNTFVGVILAYLINQLLSIPEHYKTWVTVAVVGVAVLSAWLMIKQSQYSSSSSSGVSANKIKGKRNILKASVKARIDRNVIDGEDNQIVVEHDTTQGEGNP